MTAPPKDINELAQRGELPKDPRDVAQPVSLEARRRALEWRKGLLVTNRGTQKEPSWEPKRCLANVLHVLSLHPEWHEVIAFDEFGQTVITRKRPPMREQDAPSAYRAGDWTDDDTTRTAAWFAVEVGFEPPGKMIDEAVSVVARKNVVHPVRDWLSSLEWDSVDRLESMLATYFGAKMSAYTAAVGTRWMISAVARVFRPGCKVDSILALEGDQGIGKSTALRALAGPDWFADTGITIGDKDSYQALRRKWIFEFAELASIRGRDIERVKNFLSSQVDTYRASYGRRTQDYPRQVVFAGSTNEGHYLADPTGSRRFWPVKCKAVDLEALATDREQLWAEARTRFERGEPWHLDTQELRELAAEEQAQREERDDWETIVREWLECPTVPIQGYQDSRRRLNLSEGLTTADVLLGALGFSPERISPAATKRVGHSLRALGFSPRQLREGGSRVRRYFRTCDGTCDARTKENKPLSHVTGVTGSHTYTEGDGEKGFHSAIGKPPAPAVTCDGEERESQKELSFDSGGVTSGPAQVQGDGSKGGDL